MRTQGFIVPPGESSPGGCKPPLLAFHQPQSTGNMSGKERRQVTSGCQSVCPGYEQGCAGDGQGMGLPVPCWMFLLPQSRNCCFTSSVGFWEDFLASFATA